MYRYRILISLMLLVLLLTFRPAPAATSLIASGCSISNTGYLAELARDYEKITGVKLLVLGGGSLKGLDDLQAGRVDFAASCKAKASDDPRDFKFITVSWDALVFIVNPSNPVKSITPDQVRAIYDGTIDNWKQLGGPDRTLISFIAKNMGGVGESLSRLVLNGRPVVKRQNSSLQASPAIWEQLVEDMPEGFASSGFGSARKRKVKMLAVNGVAPTRKDIVSGRYPYRRPLYLVIKKNAGPEVKRFVEFALSKKGQQLISSYGMPSLADLK
jgi:phosphate transport system substrate-binding protein